MDGNPPRSFSLLKLVIVTLLSVTALAVLAIGPRAEDQFPAGFTVVDYWEKWTGVEEAGMRMIVDDFNATVGKEKKIFVRYLSTSSIEQKTLVAIAAGVPPDIAGLYNQQIPQFASMDALEPLDAPAAAVGIDASTYKPVFWEECRFEGRLYGVVSSAYNLALYYNTQIMQERGDALRKKGLDPSRPPRTIDELEAYAIALDTFDSHGRLDSAGFLPQEPGWYLNYLCIYFGGRWWDDQNKRFTFTDPKVVRAYEWVQGFSRRLGVDAVGQFRSSLGNFDSPQNAFLAGSIVMQQQGTFLANFIRSHKPSMQGQWAAAAFPSADPSLTDVTYCNCDVLVIPRGARNKDAAMQFIAFLHRPEKMEALARAHCKISPLREVTPGFFTGHPNPYIKVFDDLAASPNAHPTEPVPILPEVTAEMDAFVQGLTAMRFTPEEGLQRMQDRLQKKYDDFIAAQQRRRQVN